MFKDLDVYYYQTYRFRGRSHGFEKSVLIPYNKEVFVSSKLRNNDLFTGQKLTDVLSIGSAVHVSVGHSKCSPKDNFDKKIGRELARQRMKEEILEVTKIVLTKEQYYVTLENEKYELCYYINYGKEFFRLESAEVL